MFSAVSPDETGIQFENILSYTNEFNVYTYRNFYNGGGIGLADINNDGLTDIFFTGNMVDNKLYLNKGNWEFEDITESAGVASPNVWSTGVSMADVNNDGFIDIFVCKSGKPGGSNRHNELFINNGDLTFTESSKMMGVADSGLSTHAAFFDYDKDGDLDCYLLNNSIQSTSGYAPLPDQRQLRDSLGGNKLYRNDEGRFTDVSKEAGIYGSRIGFGLGVSVADIDRDGWQDIYITNDFFEKDYLYINNHDGTFSESIESSVNELSMGSMGADIADFNNDGWPEIFVSEMLPESEKRLKSKAIFDDWAKYREMESNGYHRQFGRNTLQLNHGKDPSSGNVLFSEIGRLAGVEATDWSWATLIADFDNDGWKDLFVANGIFKDLLDKDYIDIMANPVKIRDMLKTDTAVIKKLVDAVPSVPLGNYMFKNRDGLVFDNVSGDWGLDTPSFSNGAAYGDLDNDGDLDLIISNVNAPPGIYRNNTRGHGNDTANFLSVNLLKEDKTLAYGTQVELVSEGKLYYQELSPMKGFQSTVDSRLHFGLGNADMIDSISVIWPDLTVSFLTDVPSNQFITIEKNTSEHIFSGHNNNARPFFTDVTTGYLEHSHEESDFVDFERSPFLLNMVSNEGPATATGDINGDGREDIFIGGAKGFPGVVLLQTPSGKFVKREQPAFENDKLSEDVGACLFDAENDGDLDLLVASGSNEYSSMSMALMNRLYLNDGQGNLMRDQGALPMGRLAPSSCVKSVDFDLDGDIDLFIGERLRDMVYGLPASGHILTNDGKGKFVDQTATVAPELKDLGMITDMEWADVDGDGDPDMVIVGEWMSVKAFINENGVFTNYTNQAGLDNSTGLWNAIEKTDIDNDGDVDFIVGNLGANSRLDCSVDRPLKMFVNDFDGNGKIEQIITKFNGEVPYPLAQKKELVAQLPFLQNKYARYSDYSGQQINDIFDKNVLARSLELQATTLGSSILLNDGKGKFEVAPLPVQAQFSPVYAIKTLDVNNDGKTDILLGGNQYRAKPEFGIYAGSYTQLLLGHDGQNFKPVPVFSSGIVCDLEIRSMEILQTGEKKYLLLVPNNGPLKYFKLNE